MSSLRQLEERIKSIEIRNKRVEQDKVWETSYARRILLVIFTYLSIALYLKFIVGTNDPWLSAIIPSIGFLLSTLALPHFKKIWVRYIYKNRSS